MSWSIFLCVICGTVSVHGFLTTSVTSLGISASDRRILATSSLQRGENANGLFKLRCSESTDSVFEAFLKSLFPSPEERRKSEVRRRRAWSSKTTSNLQESSHQENTSPKPSQYIPPEQSESSKVNIGEISNDCYFLF